MASRLYAVAIVLFVLLSALAHRSMQQLPMAMASQIDSVTTPSQFMKLMANISLPDPDIGYIIERKGVKLAEPAACKPALEVVPLRGKSTSPSVYYWPACTRIERCSGCCANPLLVSCQPTAIELLHFRVYVAKYQGGSQLTLVGNETVTVEKHTKCKCDCIVKAKDCNRYQVYNKNSCQCVCTNKDEQKKCEEDTSKKKLWNPLTCSCDCLQSATSECSTGYYLNKYTCSCEPEQRPRIRWGGIYGVDSQVSPRREYVN